MPLIREPRVVLICEASMTLVKSELASNDGIVEAPPNLASGSNAKKWVPPKDWAHAAQILGAAKRLKSDHAIVVRQLRALGEDRKSKLVIGVGRHGKTLPHIAS